MTGLPVPAIRAVRARFGDDADAVMTLRAAHRTVRPFGDRYSVDEEIVDSAELHRMAAAENARRDAKAKRTKRKTASGNPPLGKSAGTADRADGHGSALAAYSDATPNGCVDDPIVPPATTSQTEGGSPPPSVTPAPTAGIRAGTAVTWHAPGPQDLIEAAPQAVVTPDVTPPMIDLCGCGNPRSHFGRCWFRRGYAGPILNPTRRPPRTHTARLTVAETRVAALECEVDALKSAVERMRAQLAMEIGR